MPESGRRFPEEALELVLASGCAKTDALTIADCVYGRPAGGSLEEKVGGVMAALPALCVAAGLSMNATAHRKLARN